MTPIALVKLKTAYQSWLALQRNLPKVERLGLGHRIEQSFLEALELVFVSSYLSPVEKLPLLAKAISKIDILKFFLQLAWETKLFTTDQYSGLLAQLEEVGRMLGGWKRGLESKTPAH